MDETAEYNDNSAFLLPALEKDDDVNTDTNIKINTSTNDNAGSNKTGAKTVKTGDASDTAVWFLLFVSCGMVAAVTIYRRKISEG